MDQQDKIAHLNELATEHFNEGNLSAAMNAWQQVLELDASNADAKRGVQLAQQKLGAAAGDDDNPLGGGPFDEGPAADSGGGPFDADATMMFSPGATGGGPSDSPAGGDFDADATMMFNPGSGDSPSTPDFGDDDGGATMMFNPGDAAAAAPPDDLGGDDGGATMMFNPGDAAKSPPPPAKPAGDDGGATMMFNPGDAKAPPAPPPPAAPEEPVDADATMMFTPGAMPDPGGSADEPADADATMMFTPGAMPEPSAPASDSGSIDFGLPSDAPDDDAADQTMLSPDSGGFDAPAPPPPEPESPADQTVMSPDGSAFDAPSPPPADQTVMSPDDGGFEAPPPPAPPAPEPPSSGGKGGDLEDFEMPSGGLEMAGPPDGGLGGISLPEVPPPAGGDSGGGGGFSFDLPPAPPGGTGESAGAPSGDFAVPDLPSLGPPPPDAGGPPPLAPPPPPPSLPETGGGQPSGQFGEVDPGEIEDLAVPTVGAPAEGEEEQLSEEEIRRREEEKAAEFAAMYGKEAPAGGAVADDSPLSMAPAPSAIPWKLLIPLGLVVVMIVGAVGGWLYLTKDPGPEGPPPPPPPPPKIEKTAEQWAAEYSEGVKGLEVALGENDLPGAVEQAAKARKAAEEAGLEGTPELDELLETLEFEQAWDARLSKAIELFCVEQYEDAIGLFLELASTKPSDERPNQYVGRIYFNLAVIELQASRPWDAVWPLEQAVKFWPGISDAADLKIFAEQFRRGTRLTGVYEYTSQVDPLQFKKAGCN